MTADRSTGHITAAVCRHLAASWSVASIPYLSGLHSLPRPALTLAISTVVGLAGGGLESRGRSEAADVSGEVRPAAETGLPTVIELRAPAAIEPVGLDFARYQTISDPFQQPQCPRCGGLAVSIGQDGGGRYAICQVCDEKWLVLPKPSPDVSVRSWLHRL